MAISVDDVVACIKLLQDWKGSSRLAIAKYFTTEKRIDKEVLGPALKKALEDGMKSGVLIQEKSSYKVKGVVFEEPAETRVIITTLQEGAGEATVQAGDSVTVNYVGRLMDGTQFDASDDFEFEVDGGEVIKGWDRGVKGMKKGEKRKLVIPPKMGYGKRGSPPEIPPDATLEFEITLVGIKR